MTTVYEVPLSATPQRLSVSMGGVQYRLTVRWIDVMACWVLDIADVNGFAILSGIPMITGADLLAQYGYLNFGGQLIAQSDFDVTAVPTFDNLGLTGHLYWVTNP